jgi:lysine biosynthesis protein LysW
MAVAFCPECEQGVKLGTNPQEGQKVSCPECGANLEVISLSPLELDWAYDAPEEDFDDEDWDFDDEDWDFDDEDWEDDEDWDDEDLETEVEF